MDRRPGLRPEGQLDESFTAVHFAAGRHHIVDGGSAVGWVRGLPAVAGVGITASRLPHNSSNDVLSRGKPRCDGVVGDFTAGTKLRADSRTVADDVDEFVWLLGDHAAIQSGSEYRRGGTGSTGGNQQRVATSAEGSAESADLQQDQSCGCADFDIGTNFRHAALAKSGR